MTGNVTGYFQVTALSNATVFSFFFSMLSTGSVHCPRQSIKIDARKPEVVVIRNLVSN